ncbi:MAG: glycosyltransferase family protein, partial [Hyphomicrobiales bacterium]
FELRPLLQEAHALSPRPLVVSSIRDILQEGRKPERIAETTKLIQDYFDAVLVHGDERIAPLSLSFPNSNMIADKVHYTGIVRPTRISASQSDTADIIVSAGGGAVGANLLHTTALALPSTKVSNARWLFVTGPNLDNEAFEELRISMPENCRTERFREDLPELLHHAKLSISQAGYNTVADILGAGCRCVLVPFASGGETEQTRRAEILAQKGRAVVVSEDVLTPEEMAKAINGALQQSAPKAGLGTADGAHQSALILKSLLAGRKS